MKDSSQPAKSVNQHSATKPASEPPLAIWERVAHWWDKSTGRDGNGFHRDITEPTNDLLLQPRAGMRVLDLACGNGNYARHLAELGCDVHATDGSNAFLQLAASYTLNTRPGITPGKLTYAQCDLTNPAQLAELPGGFDAAVCSMALMDFDPIEPFFVHVRQKIKPGGVLVFSVSHPAFNSGGVRMVAELINEGGKTEQRFGVSVHSYLRPRVDMNAGILNQPEPHLMWHRPVAQLLKAAFMAGWTVSGYEEPGSPPTMSAGRSPFTWARRPELPVALFVRLQ